MHPASQQGPKVGLRSTVCTEETASTADVLLHGSAYLCRHHRSANAIVSSPPGHDVLAHGTLFVASGVYARLLVPGMPYTSKAKPYSRKSGLVWRHKVIAGAPPYARLVRVEEDI